MVLCQRNHRKTSQSFEYSTVLYGVPVPLKQHKPIIAHPAICLYLTIHWVVRLCLRIEYNVSVAKVKRQISASREETSAWSEVTNRQRLHQVQVVQCLLTARGESAQDPAPGMHRFSPHLTLPPTPTVDPRHSWYRWCVCMNPTLYHSGRPQTPLLWGLKYRKLGLCLRAIDIIA